MRQIDQAWSMVQRCLFETPDAPDVQLNLASILALHAKYDVAVAELLSLLLPLPGHPVILMRLVAVCEQLQDIGKAVAFLRACRKLSSEDAWGAAKMEQFEALGLA
ncbi:MAG: hypothetical protein IV100_17370 [Myxococcales bacterium]|nr:hypothetical protein [Myxococcales bacterium]